MSKVIVTTFANGDKIEEFFSNNEDADRHANYLCSEPGITRVSSWKVIGLTKEWSKEINHARR